MFFKGLAFQGFKEKKSYSFFFSKTDHACVFNLKEDLEILGHSVVYFDVNKDGAFDINKVIEQMKATDNPVMNFTSVNNETGVVWPWEWAQRIVKETNALVHVDAVQRIGKVLDWHNLPGDLSAFTFSGHKFGSLKGIGFTFLKKDIVLNPLIIGGTQQNGKRAGTENAVGVCTLKLALEDYEAQFSGLELKQAHKHLEEKIQSLIKDRAELVAPQAERNLNTFFVVFPGLKAEVLSMKFDMEGVDLSTGSACSSGVIKENRVLMAMGYSKEDSRSALRFSFSPFMSFNEAVEYGNQIEKILKTLLK